MEGAGSQGRLGGFLHVQRAMLNDVVATWFARCGLRVACDEGIGRASRYPVQSNGYRRGAASRPPMEVDIVDDGGAVWCFVKPVVAGLPTVQRQGKEAH